MTVGTQIGLSALASTQGLPDGFTRERLLQAFRLMYMSRSLDDREILLKRQNKIFFQISAAGHEAIQVAAGLVARPGYDWIFPYYRDRSLALALGMTAEDMLLQAVGAARDPSSGGRQMPSHWSSPSLHIVTSSSPTGTQFLHGVGCAQGSRYQHPSTDEITLVSGGEGATSEGEFWEAINGAALDRLPVLFLIQDNGYAISVPVERQTPGGNISRLLEGVPGLLRIEVDGTDFVESFRALQEAAAYCRAGHGPSLVHASVVRPYSHSLSDDERFYKPQAERESEARRDPLTRFPDLLVEKGWASRAELDAIRAETDSEVANLSQKVLREPSPAKTSIFRFLYSEDVDPRRAALETEPVFTGEARTMIDSINQTLAEEMRRDERVLVFGEDVADCSREEHLAQVKGKGGVFKATMGLQREFGSTRCFNTPIAEAAIIGRSVGLAVRGLKPVPEIQFFDYVWPAMMQLRDEVANFRWRSNNGFSCAMVVRIPIGGYLTGGSIYHSQCGEVAFTHIPGLRVVFPSNALDACGLLRTAIRSDDPVLFLEHKKLYREPYNRSPHPGSHYTVPFGKAKVVKPGEHLTVITYGALVQKSLQAALQLEAKYRGSTVEVIDLRSLSPYDWVTIETSVRKTSRVLIAYEDVLSWGYGAEIAARIADDLFTCLDAPVGRVAAKDTWVAYNPELEDEILPQVADLVHEGERLLSF
ncbi:MAG: thiamine pyrophosphate-dependent enzyme [Bryobacteraceae bacterium]